MSCQVGECSFNNSTRKECRCSKCGYSLCRECLKIYLLGLERDKEISCPNYQCNMRWTREILLSLLPKTWIGKEFKKRREDLLLEEEKEQLPEILKKIEEINKRISDDDNFSILEKDKIKEKISALEEQRRILLNQIDEISDKINLLTNAKRNLIITSIQETGESSEERKEFTVRCPSEKCSGFLSSKWICAVCKNHYCHFCHELKGEGHQCSPNILANIEFLKKEKVKSCPFCGMSICKTEGCNHMFCTKCHQGFDWKTMRKINRNNTNPLYYEWINSRGENRRVEGDVPREAGIGGSLCDPHVPCGGLPNESQVIQYLKKMCLSEKERYEFIQPLRFANHISEIELPRIRAPLVDLNKLRLAFLRKEINEEKWKRKLQQLEKKREYNLEIMDIFDTIVIVMIDLYGNLLSIKDESNSVGIVEVMEQIENFKEHCIDLFKRISSSYGYIGYTVNSDWNLTKEKRSVKGKEKETLDEADEISKLPREDDSDSD